MTHEPNTLIIREYERFAVGSRWNAAAKTISEKEVAAIVTYQGRLGMELIEFGYRNARATNWVGTLGVGEKTVEVIPKIDSSVGPLSEAKTRENLLYMLSRAGYVPLAPAEITRMVHSGKPLLAAFLDLYVDNLAREWRRGAIRNYVTQSENRSFLRGKLLYRDQLRENLIQQQRFFTSCDEFIEDNRVARLLKAALERCCRQRLCADVARKAKSLILDFESVSSVVFSGEELQRIEVDRQIQRFGPLVSLAKIILREGSPSSSPSGDTVYSLMFDMNEVFERFVAAELTQSLVGQNLIVKSQVRGKSLLQQNGKQRFQLRPDIGVFRDGKALCLLDTKWKRLDSGKPYGNVSQADMYQMYAYGKEFEAPLTVLVYPRHGNLPAVVSEYEHNDPASPGAEPKRIVVGTVDVTNQLNLLLNQQQVRADLARLASLKNS